MATLPESKTVSYEEWINMPEVEDAVEEVVNGEIRIMPPPKSLHARIVQRLNRILDRQLDPDRTLLLSSAFGLVIRKKPLTCREPDLAVFAFEGLVEQDGYFHSPPQLVAEILSPGNTRQERSQKLADYAEIGLPEVWVVSPETRTVEVLLFENGQLKRAQLLADGDILKPKLFPHVQVDIAQIWPD
jgi:Uma2 family endonuclease